jgi:hypothetical protein
MWRQLPLFRFPGVYQRATPVADMTTLIKIALAVPGKLARVYQIECYEWLYLHHSSDEALTNESKGRLTQATEIVNYIENTTDRTMNAELSYLNSLD